MRKSQEGFFIRPHVYDAFNKIFLERHDESIDMKWWTDGIGQISLQDENI